MIAASASRFSSLINAATSELNEPRSLPISLFDPRLSGSLVFDPSVELVTFPCSWYMMACDL